MRAESIFPLIFLGPVVEDLNMKFSTPEQENLSKYQHVAG
jgi:hypothetical protein